MYVFFFKQKTAYEMRISDWSSDVCSSDLSVSPMRLNMRELNGEARRVLSLAWPVMLTSLNWTLLHLIDVAVVGQVSTHELGALAAGRALTYVPIIVGIADMSGVLVFTSRADGAGARRRIGGRDRKRVGWGKGVAVGVARGG